MPRVTTKVPAGAERRLWGGRLVAAVPAVVLVSPLPEDREPLDYDLELELDVIGGRMACVKLTAIQRKGGPPVTTENLRRVPVAQIVQFAALDRGLVSEVASAPDKWNSPPTDFAAAGMTDEALEQAARVYRRASAVGLAPYGVLERDYGIPRAKAARWIATAKRRGILGDEDG